MAAGQESLTSLEIRRLETEAEFREALETIGTAPAERVPRWLGAPAAVVFLLTTVILATNRPAEIHRFDRVLQFTDGRLVFDGAPAEWSARNAARL